MKDSIFPTDNTKRHSPIASPRPESRPTKRIVIEFIDHKSQRYNTVGDYFQSALLGETIIRVSNLGDERYEALVAIHELIEMVLCRHAGITDEQIDKFDMNWKDFEDRFGEPGNDPKAPYFEQHQTAIRIERELAEQLEVDWDIYEDKIDSLSEKEEKKDAD
jgi:hypothetical protein